MKTNQCKNCTHNTEYGCARMIDLGNSRIYGPKEGPHTYCFEKRDGPIPYAYLDRRREIENGRNSRCEKAGRKA